MSNATRKSSHASVSEQEIARFNAMAADWWAPDGPSRPLFALNPARLTFLRNSLASESMAVSARAPLEGLNLLDLGCGGGLVSEPLARMGAKVTGVDAAEDNIAVARAHAAAMELDIDYRATTAEALVEEGARFDAVVCLEVVEHVADVPLFLESCAALLAPGGRFVFSTLNRSASAFAAAIVGAEYILRMVPRGTHDWRKFITPEEMQALLTAAGFGPAKLSGLTFRAGSGQWDLTSNLSVNYIGMAKRV